MVSNQQINFITKYEVPIVSKVTYENFVCYYRPLKPKPHRIRLVAGGDKLDYDGDAEAPAASLVTTKKILHIVISGSKDDAIFMSCDLEDFFLAVPMLKPEYMNINKKHIPQDITERHNLNEKISQYSFIYVNIKKVMYGLKQADILAFDSLVHNLTTHGYTPVPITIGIWNNTTRRTKFCLYIDNFGVKYYTKEDAMNLLDSLNKKYTYTMDWQGQHLYGLRLTWEYEKKFVDVSMPNYIRNILLRFNHQQPKSPQHSPHEHIPIKYD